MNSFTGSHIGLGIVLLKNNQEQVKMALFEIIKKFVSDKYSITTYCNDTDKSNEYVQEKLTTAFIEKLLDEDCFTIRFDTHIYNGITQILISNETIENYYAIQLDFHEETLLKTLNNSYFDCMNFIDNLAIDLFKKIDFEYIFCDNNASLEVSVESQEYSLLYLPDNKHLKVIRREWELDGFSVREKKQIGTFTLKAK